MKNVNSFHFKTQSLKFSSHHCSMNSLLGNGHSSTWHPPSCLVQGVRLAASLIYSARHCPAREESESCRLVSWEPLCTALLDTGELVILGTGLFCGYFLDVLWNLSPTCQLHSGRTASQASCKSDLFESEDREWPLGPDHSSTAITSTLPRYHWAAPAADQGSQLFTSENRQWHC